MTQVDGFVISTELVSLLKCWHENEMPDTYIKALLNVQDYLSRQLGENLGNPKELASLSHHINNLVGIRDELKSLLSILNTDDNG